MARSPHDRDLAEGAARADINWKAEGIRSSAVEFVARDIFGLSAGLDICPTARQCLEAKVGMRFLPANTIRNRRRER